jgi:hypothetical protein
LLLLGRQDVDARDERGHDESEMKSQHKTKKPRGFPRGFCFLIIVLRNVPFFADLAATYSSKP